MKRQNLTRQLTLKMYPREERSLPLIEQAKGLRNTPWCDQYEQMISGMLYVFSYQLILNKRWAVSHLCVLKLLSDVCMLRYNSFVHELTEARFRARRLLSKYNSTPIPDEMTPDELRANREAILGQLLGSLGSNVYLEPPIFVDYGCNISVGDNFYANFQ